MTHADAHSRAERLRQRLGDDRAFVGAALGAAACFPTSLILTGPLDREPTSAVNLAVMCLDIMLGIAIAAARPVRSDSRSNRDPAGGRA